MGGPPPGPATDIPDEAWQAAFGSVFLGAVRLSRALAAELTEGGAIAFVLSSSVRVPIPGLAISNGLRPGLAGWAKTLAEELGPRGIRVNGLLPGWIATDRMRELGPAPAGAGGQHPAAAHRDTGRVRPAGRHRAVARGQLPDRGDAPGRRRRAPGHLSVPGSGPGGRPRQLTVPVS